MMTQIRLTQILKFWNELGRGEIGLDSIGTETFQTNDLDDLDWWTWVGVNLNQNH